VRERERGRERERERERGRERGIERGSKVKGREEEVENLLRFFTKWIKAVNKMWVPLKYEVMLRPYSHTIFLRTILR